MTSRWRIIGQCAVLISAILLVGGYVYVQAGGQLWPWSKAAEQAAGESTPPVFSSSKLGILRFGPGALEGEQPQGSASAEGEQTPGDGERPGRDEEQSNFGGGDGVPPGSPRSGGDSSRRLRSMRR